MRALTDANLDELRQLRDRGDFFWLDLNDPGPETLAGVAEVLGLHELAVEDTREFGQRPKADFYQRQILLVYYGASIDDEGLPCPVELHLHISSEFVLSVQRGRCRELEDMRGSLERRPSETEQALIYRVIDALTDSILEVLEQVNERIEGYEQNIYEHPRARDRDHMAVLRRSLGWRAVDDVEAARDNLQGMLDTYSNEVQERLTIVATIFLPLTVLTGFYGGRSRGPRRQR